MLVLTRKAGQSIIIGDLIEITIIQVRGDNVRIGITAPSSVSVKRKELIDRAGVENIVGDESPVTDA